MTGMMAGERMERKGGGWAGRGIGGAGESTENKEGRMDTTEDYRKRRKGGERGSRGRKGRNGMEGRGKKAPENRVKYGEIKEGRMVCIKEGMEGLGRQEEGMKRISRKEDRKSRK